MYNTLVSRVNHHQNITSFEIIIIISFNYFSFLSGSHSEQVNGQVQILIKQLLYVNWLSLVHACSAQLEVHPRVYLLY